MINQDIWQKAEEIVQSRYNESQLDKILLDDFVDEVNGKYDELMAKEIKF